MLSSIHCLNSGWLFPVATYWDSRNKKPARLEFSQVFSAESHSAELEGLVTDMKDIQVRMEKMEEPSEEKEAELRKKLDAEMAPAVQKMTQEMMRVSQNPEIMLVLGPIFQKMQD